MPRSTRPPLPSSGIRREIRRLLNVGGSQGETRAWIDELLAALALDDGVVHLHRRWGTTPTAIQSFGEEVAPAPREIVARRARRPRS